MNSPDFCYLLSRATRCGNRGRGGALHHRSHLQLRLLRRDIWSGSEPSRGCTEPAATMRSPRDLSHKQDHLGHIVLPPSIPRQAECRGAWGRGKGCSLGTTARAPLWPDPPFVLLALHRATYSLREATETFLPSVFQRGALFPCRLGSCRHP